MKRALLTVAALFAISAPAAALANVYIVYTSGFEVTSTTGCSYGGSSGSLVTMANGNEGCMVQASAAADDGSDAAAALIDEYELAGGYDDGHDENIVEEEIYEERAFDTRR